MSVIFFPRRLTGPRVAYGMPGHAPCRDVADLPDDLRERVLAARGVAVEQRQPEPPEAA